MKQRKNKFDLMKSLQAESGDKSTNGNIEKEESENESSDNELVTIEQDSQNNRIKEMPELLLWYTRFSLGQTKNMYK